MIYKFDHLLSEDDVPLVELKCIFCGREERIPAWIYESAAEFLELFASGEPPSFFCINWMCESLYLKALIKDWFDRDGKYIGLN